MTIKQSLQFKQDLLLELSEISHRLEAVLSEKREDGFTDTVTMLINRRTEIMRNIDVLDQAIQGSTVADTTDCDGIKTTIFETLTRLNDQQGRISKLLNHQMSQTRLDLDKVRTSRRKLKGFYNNHVASISSFIDKKR